MIKYGISKDDAIQAYNKNQAFSLPLENPYRRVTIEHGYGDHLYEDFLGCPICEAHQPAPGRDQLNLTDNDFPMLEFGTGTNDLRQLVHLLRERACPAGEPWTGDRPDQDHGHTDCYLYHSAAKTIEKLQQLIVNYVQAEEDYRFAVHFDKTYTTIEQAHKEAKQALWKQASLPHPSPRIISEPRIKGMA